MRRVRVFLRCDAGREDGLGHVMRCLVLAEAFRDHGFEPRFITAFGADPVGKDRIDERGFGVIAAPGRVGTAEDRDALMGLLGETPDAKTVLVVDSKRADPAYLTALRDLAIVVAIDDDAACPLPADLIVNSGVGATQALYPMPCPGRDLLLGTAFNLIHPGYFAIHRENGECVVRLLVTFGGEDPANHTIWAMERLLPNLPGVMTDIVIGPAHPDPVSIRQCAYTLPNVTLIDRPSTLLPVMARADLAISAAGTTMFELAAASVPTLAVAVEPHQHVLLDPMVEACAVLPLAHAMCFDDAAASVALKRLAADSVLRDKMRGAQKRLFPRPGAAGVVAAVERRIAEVQGAVQ